MDWTDVMLYGVFPYLSLLLFFGGVIYRFANWISAQGLTGLYSVAVKSYTWSFGARASEVVKRVFVLYTLTLSDRMLLVGSLLFHWGIWLALLGHLSMIIPPETLGMPSSLHEAIALYVGGGAGVVALIGLLILLIRRIVRQDVRRLSFLDDWFALVLLLGIVVLGLYQTLILHPDYMHTVAPWVQSVLVGSPDLSIVATWSLVTKIHVLLALIFIAYVPFGKLIHPFSFLAMPTLWKPPTKLYGYLLAKLRPSQ
ncbi:respiratory nitrate reductase subunit gamma [Thermoproteus tenax]|uniref:Nitrate reductase gamma chain n=1 Tax=Thermoproteus tenax (strain ATCC 35583 / DSM 2078 / JCM 9277 / NBRC 100435 / Kra 1) TaxID=768679 RepID=G4RNF6_THETK|nr:respiratory nitrate reductase subunit gamma [Thermoproteus tenax]CCC81100.1 nitrate reductase gamma chain [Thermoproteus tenax Kra 1]